jgi:hypothetical protein
MHDILKKSCLINKQLMKYCMLHNIRNDSEVIEKIQVQVLAGERSFTLVFPKNLAVELGVGKGDFLRCYVDNNRLIAERLSPEI